MNSKQCMSDLYIGMYIGGTGDTNRMSDRAFQKRLALE